MIDLTGCRQIEIALIINATPLGMYPHIKALPIPPESICKGQYIFDFVYNPINTKLIGEAQKRGAKTISGLEMFVGQALKQIELYSGRKITEADKKYARRILIKHL